MNSIADCVYIHIFIMNMGLWTATYLLHCIISMLILLLLLTILFFCKKINQSFINKSTVLSSFYSAFLLTTTLGLRFLDRCSVSFYHILVLLLVGIGLSIFISLGIKKYGIKKGSLSMINSSLNIFIFTCVVIVYHHWNMFQFIITPCGYQIGLDLF